MSELTGNSDDNAIDTSTPQEIYYARGNREGSYICVQYRAKDGHARAVRRRLRELLVNV